MDSLNEKSHASNEDSPLTRLYQDPRVHIFLLTLYYLLIILALIVMYGRGDFSTPPFIYQGF